MALVLEAIDAARRLHAENDPTDLPGGDVPAEASRREPASVPGGDVSAETPGRSPAAVPGGDVSAETRPLVSPQLRTTWDGWPIDYGLAIDALLPQAPRTPLRAPSAA